MSQATIPDTLTEALDAWTNLEPDRCRKAAGGFHLWLGLWTVLGNQHYTVQIAVERAVVARGWHLMHQYSPVTESHFFVVEVPFGHYSQGFPTKGAEPELAALQSYIAALRTLFD